LRERDGGEFGRGSRGSGWSRVARSLQRERRKKGRNKREEISDGPRKVRSV